jgi:hypothetical protein
MRRIFRGARSNGPVQGRFGFIERSSRRRRWFKRLIVLATLLAIGSIAWASPWGRYGLKTAASGVREAARSLLGLPRPRSEVDDAWRRYRQLGVEASRRGLERVFAEADPAQKRLLRYAGLDPEHGLPRWGNYDQTLLLASTVFEPDDRGRSYRLRPSTRSVWLMNTPQHERLAIFYLVPDGPGLAEAIRGTPAVAIASSRQTTNSWGCRGPEPEPDAPLRGLVLGDSYMQGMLIGDDETPPECLRRYLARERVTRVSMLNTGVLGYSPEQYYYSLAEFADRFRPHFVVVSIFTNDFGDLHGVPTDGAGDWEEGKYWLDKIADYCRVRDCPFLFVPVPYVPGMLGKRRLGHYPGGIMNVLDINGTNFVDVDDAFIDEHLDRMVAGLNQGKRPQGCLLFNDAIGDGHFSALGSEVWARRVGERLMRLLDAQRALRRRPPSPAPASMSAIQPAGRPLDATIHPH